jgi:trehalose transport system permease protein
MNLKRREAIFGFALALPAVVYIVAMMLYPLGYLVELSFSTGLKHYRYIFNDTMFGDAVVSTLAIALGSVAMELCFGFIAALMLSRDFKGRGFTRSLYLLPWAIPTVASSFLWRYSFSNTGWFNSLLSYLGSNTMTNWLIEHPYIPLIVAESWKMTPLVMLILLAGLQSIPRELLESARVDGATTVQSFSHITLPMMIPVVISALVVRLVDALRIFTSAWIITGGGGIYPVIGTYVVRLYEHGLLGPSAAASVVLVLMVAMSIGILTYISRRVAKR